MSSWWPWSANSSSENKAETITTAQTTKIVNDDEKCPVDHKTREAYLKAAEMKKRQEQSASQYDLSKEREISSIPRFIENNNYKNNDSNTSPSSCPAHNSGSSSGSHVENGGEGDGLDKDGKWVYPSPAQFHEALTRKNYKTNPKDMDIVVPIHNAVNEKCWNDILDWETRQGGISQDNIKLVSFRGRPNDRTPRAWLKTLAGYQAPFDRHDWIVDRGNGERIRYVIDFYTGKSTQSLGMKQPSPQLSFHIDARPAIDGYEGVRMRFFKALGFSTDVQPQQQQQNK